MKRMSIYAHPHVRNSGSFFGYAYTYYEIERHMKSYLETLGIKLELNSPKSSIQLYYGSPDGFFYDHQYKIQMTQWESTLVPPNWVDHSSRYDEWWTANKFGAQAFIDAGVPESKVHVYEHGVDYSTWTPKKRGVNGKVRFLHVDSGSPRKRADLVVDAFKKAFGDNPDYELTLKYSHHDGSSADWNNIKTLESHGEWQGVNIRNIKENLSLEDLVKLFHFHDVLIYPSEGEGFGLIPLQALATGMPVISTGRWCSYEHLLNGNVIDSTLGQSHVVESYTRFGDVVLPSLESTIELMKKVAKGIDSESEIFFKQIPQVVKEYDWNFLTKKSIDGLIDRVGIDFFDSSKGYLS